MEWVTCVMGAAAPGEVWPWGLKSPGLSHHCRRPCTASGAVAKCTAQPPWSSPSISSPGAQTRQPHFCTLTQRARVPVAQPTRPSELVPHQPLPPPVLTEPRGFPSCGLCLSCVPRTFPGLASAQMSPPQEGCHHPCPSPSTAAITPVLLFSHLFCIPPLLAVNPMGAGACLQPGTQGAWVAEGPGLGDQRPSDL